MNLVLTLLLQCNGRTLIVRQCINKLLHLARGHHPFVTQSLKN